jgi:hypothetical protein
MSILTLHFINIAIEEKDEISPNFIEYVFKNNKQLKWRTKFFFNFLFTSILFLLWADCKVSDTHWGSGAA